MALSDWLINFIEPNSSKHLEIVVKVMDKAVYFKFVPTCFSWVGC